MMADEQLLALLDQGTDAWNAWRQQECSIANDPAGLRDRIATPEA
jgi:hypothetical protein